MRRCRPAVSLTAALAAALAVVAPLHAGDGELEQSLTMLDRLEDATLSVTYDGEPIARVLDELSEVLPYPLDADWTALELIEVDPRSNVSLKVRGSSALSALRGIAAQLGYGTERPLFEVFGGRVVLTTSDGATNMRVTSMYDVRDLLRDEVHAAIAPAPSAADDDADPGTPEPAAPRPISRDDEPRPIVNPGDPPAATMPDFQLDPDLGRDLPPPTPGEAFALTLMEHIDPEAWLAYGGFRAHVTDRGGVLMVTAAPTTHRRFRAALDQLRKAYATNVALQFRVVELPRASYEKLRRRHGRSPATIATAVASADDATTLWSQRSDVATGRVLTSESSAHGTAIRVRCTPELDAARGTVTLDLDVTITTDDDRRTLQSAITLAGLDAASTLELAGARDDERIRVLVIRR